MDQVNSERHSLRAPRQRARPPTALRHFGRVAAKMPLFRNVRFACTLHRGSQPSSTFRNLLPITAVDSAERPPFAGSKQGFEVSGRLSGWRAPPRAIGAGKLNRSAGQTEVRDRSLGVQVAAHGAREHLFDGGQRLCNLLQPQNLVRSILVINDGFQLQYGIVSGRTQPFTFELRLFWIAGFGLGVRSRRYCLDQGCRYRSVV